MKIQWRHRRAAANRSFVTPPYRAPGPLVSVENVSYMYDAAATAGGIAKGALKNVSLTVGHGEYVAILGHNGSGKSTLARLLNGLLMPSTGTVLVNGIRTDDVTRSAAIRETVGMIFSDPDSQIIATVVEDDVGWSLASRHWPREAISQRVDAVLRQVGLSHLRTKPPHELSGGQKQRLAIASVLALAPSCIIADEPTALLDPQSRADMVGLLHELHAEQHIAVVHITHLLEEAAQADRVIVLNEGHIAWQGIPADLFQNLALVRSYRLNVPELAQVGEVLRAARIPIPASALSPDDLMAAFEDSQ